MEYLRKVVRTNKEPDEKEVLWVDTAHPDYPVMKYYENGNWKLIRQREDGVAYIMPYGGIPYSDLSQEVKTAIASGGAQANWNQTNSASPDFIWNKPYIPTALADLTEDSSHKFVSATEKTSWNNKADSSDIPNVSGKADKVQSAVEGHIATLDSSGNLVDSGKGISDINPLWGNIQGSIENQTDLISALSDKQNTIADLSNIRAGAAAGATAYQKPSTGIPSTDLASGVIPDVSSFITKNVNDLTYYYTKTETDAKLSAVYKPAGNVDFINQLGALTAENLGKVYNVLNGFTTTSNFMEGSGKKYPAGTNVVIVQTGSSQNPTYKYDVLAGFVDLSPYAVKSVVNAELDKKQGYSCGMSFPSNQKEGDVFELLQELETVSNSDYNEIVLPASDSRPDPQTMCYALQLDVPEGASGVICTSLVAQFDRWYEVFNLTTEEVIELDGNIWTQNVVCDFPNDEVGSTFAKLPAGCTSLVLADDFGNMPDLDLTEISITFAGNPTLYQYTNGSWVKCLTEAERTAWNAKYDKPIGGIPKTDLADAVQTSLGKADTALQSFTETDPTVPSWAKASSKPSYDYSEINNTPTIPDVTGKADKVSGATNNNFAALDSNGNLTDSGKSASDLATAAQGAKADTAYQKPSTGIPASDLADGVIPTVPTDVVKYSSQSLTDAQKAQARTNICAEPDWSGLATLYLGGAITAEQQANNLSVLQSIVEEGVNIFAGSQKRPRVIIDISGMRNVAQVLGSFLANSRYTIIVGGFFVSIFGSSSEIWHLSTTDGILEGTSEVFQKSPKNAPFTDAEVAAAQEGVEYTIAQTAGGDVPAADSSAADDTFFKYKQGWSYGFIPSADNYFDRDYYDVYFDLDDRKIRMRVYLENNRITILWKKRFSGEFSDLKNKPTTIAGYGITDAYTKTEVDSKVSSAYKAAGTVASVANLGTLDAAHEGFVYNMSASFTTTSDFVEGTGITHPAGTNVAIVNTGTVANPVYKYDVLAGFVDISGKADKSEMSVVDGTDANADKTTITLKSGTSATVLKSHQNISGKADKVSNATNGHLAGLDSNGNLTDSGKSASDFQPTIDSSHKLSYTLLSDTPTIPAAQVQTDWNASSGMGVLLNKPTIPTVPAISTNIQTDKTSTTMTASPSAVYNEVHPAIATIQPAGGFLPNVVYDLGTLSGSQSFTLATASDATIANAYHWTFETGSTAPSVTWPTGVIWPTGFEPTINANCHYEVLVRKGYITMLEFDLS